MIASAENYGLIFNYCSFNVSLSVRMSICLKIFFKRKMYTKKTYPLGISWVLREFNKKGLVLLILLKIWTCKLGVPKEKFEIDGILAKIVRT